MASGKVCKRKLRDGRICKRSKFTTRPFCHRCIKVADPRRRMVELERRKRSKAQADAGGESDIEIVAEKSLDDVLRERTEENKRTGKFIDLTEN